MRNFLRTTVLLASLLCIFMLFACAPEKISKKDAFPGMYQETTLSILVLPPINESTAADAKEYYSATIAEPLTYMGYYVFPVEVVMDVMKNEGAYDTETLMNLPPQKFKEYFGADAVMYIRITQWDTSYYVIGGHVSVGVALDLKSTTTGAELWSYKGVMRVNTSGSTSGGVGGLLAGIIVTAIKTATQDYVPVARLANAMVISTMPCGKYHPLHGQDQGSQVIKPQ
ncbi:MAG: GNA1162 family protein [Dissulfurispiraceae bacterium]